MTSAWVRRFNEVAARMEKGDEDAILAALYEARERAHVEGVIVNDSAADMRRYARMIAKGRYRLT